MQNAGLVVKLGANWEMGGRVDMDDIVPRMVPMWGKMHMHTMCIYITFVVEY